MSYRQFTRSRRSASRSLSLHVGEDDGGDDPTIAEAIQTDVFRMATFTCAFLLLVVTIGSSPSVVREWYLDADKANVRLSLLAAWAKVKDSHPLFHKLLSVDPSWVRLASRPEPKEMGLALPVNSDKDMNLEDIATYVTITAAMDDAFKQRDIGTGTSTWISDRERPYRPEIREQLLKDTLETYFNDHDQSAGAFGRTREVELIATAALNGNRSTWFGNIAGRMHWEPLEELTEIIDKDLKDARAKFATFQRALRSRIARKLAEGPISLTQSQAEYLEVVVQDELDLMPEVRSP